MKKVRSQLGLAPNQKIGRSGKEATSLGRRNEWRRWCDQSQGDHRKEEPQSSSSRCQGSQIPCFSLLATYHSSSMAKPSRKLADMRARETHTWGPTQLLPLALTALQSRAGRPRVGTQASLKVLVNHFVPPKTVRGCI